MKSKIKVFDTPAQLAQALAAEFQQAVNRAARLDRNFYVALSGGSTPNIFFQALAKPQFRNDTKWENVHFFWGDERCVPPDHPESNFGMTRRNLFDHIAIPGKNIHRVYGESNPLEEANRYAVEIENTIPTNGADFPRFDWILLGMGSDGHTASIFPGSNTITEKDKICAVAIHPITGQKRITLTLPVINHARRISFLVTGQSKASVVAEILRRSRKTSNLPAAMVQPSDGILEWHLDRTAGALISALRY